MVKDDIFVLKNFKSNIEGIITKSDGTLGQQAASAAGKLF